MPRNTKKAIGQTLIADPENSRAVARVDSPKARKAVWRMADDMLAIADGIPTQPGTGEGAWIRFQAVVARAKVQIETRKWLLARLMPQTYGDATQQLVAGGMVNVQVNVVMGDRGL
jgi:hypothetical protein